MAEDEADSNPSTVPPAVSTLNASPDSIGDRQQDEMVEESESTAGDSETLLPTRPDVSPNDHILLASTADVTLAEACEPAGEPQEVDGDSRPQGTSCKSPHKSTPTRDPHGDMSKPLEDIKPVNTPPFMVC